MNQIPITESEKIDREMEIAVGETGSGKMLLKIYHHNSLIDELYADDVMLQDDVYFAVKDGKPIALIPKTYYVRCVSK